MLRFQYLKILVSNPLSETSKDALKKFAAKMLELLNWCIGDTTISVHLFGHFSGYNATLILDNETYYANIYCYGNGCKNFIRGSAIDSVYHGSQIFRRSEKMKIFPKIFGKNKILTFTKNEVKFVHFRGI